jgi:hypothetical protein
MKTFLSIIKTTASVVGVLLLAAVFIEGSYWIRAPHDQAVVDGSAFAPVDPTPVPTNDVPIPPEGESIPSQDGTQPTPVVVAAPVASDPAAPVADPVPATPPADVQPPPPPPAYPVAHGAPCVPPGVVVNGNCQAPQPTPPPTADPTPGS